MLMISKALKPKVDGSSNSLNPTIDTGVKRKLKIVGLTNPVKFSE